METVSVDTKFLEVVQYSNDPEFALVLRNAIRNNKIVHLANVDTNQDVFAFYKELVPRLGAIVNVDEDAHSGNATDAQWTDIRYVAEDKDRTFRHSNRKQPLHTDGAYTNFKLDINFFFCEEAAEVGGATTFIDSDELLSIMRKWSPELLQKLEETEVEFDKGHNQSKVSKIIDRDERGIRLNWNYYRVSPKNSEDVKQMAEEFQAFLEDRIVAGGLLTPVYIKPGEAAFFQDERLLHGRNAFFGSRNLIKGGFNFD